MISLARRSAYTASRWISALVLTVSMTGLLQILNIAPVFADESGTSGYPWTSTNGANCVSGTNCTGSSGTYDWGYTLDGQGHCPSVDTNCLSYPYPNSTSPTAGMGDTWGYGVRNCTSYAAWKINQVYSVSIPSNWGNASAWDTNASSAGYSVHSPTSYKPQVGDLAQWGTEKAGGAGHVAYVWNIEYSGTADLYDYNEATTGAFGTYTTASASEGTPDHYISIGHSTPAAIARDSNDMDVFYNDGKGNLVDYGWNPNTNWTHQSWYDAGGIMGQPVVISRSSTSLDVFYTTAQNKIVNRGWNSVNGWTGPNTLVSSDVASTPAATDRDSSHMQVFYRTLEGDVKSVAWDSTNGWNLNPQLLYSTAAITDPTATTRGSNSMEVFFGKNNGHLVHLGWSSSNGWGTDDFAAGAGVNLKPSAITRNSGGNMSAYYMEQGNGKVAEEAWNWQTGWGWQDWTASLAGAPSAVPGVTYVIDDFYRETGGNVVDRYFDGSIWQTRNIALANNATSDPYAITRGTAEEEVFYWNGTNLVDNNWDTTRQTWVPSQIN